MSNSCAAWRLPVGPAEKPREYRIQCAWCGLERLPSGEFVSPPPTGYALGTLISHTICPSCDLVHFGRDKVPR